MRTVPHRSRRSRPHDRRRRHQAASDLPRRPLGRVARRRSRSPTRPTRRRPPARPTTRPRRSTRRRSRPRSPRSRSPARCPPTSAAAILREISAGIKARREELGRLIALEAGKPIRDALVEVDRATLTFRLGAEEAERMTGELIPLDLMPASQGPGRDHPPLPDRPDRRRSARSTSRSTSPPTSSRRPSRRATRSCSSRRPRTRSRCSTVAEIIEAAGAPAGLGQHPADDPRARRPDGRRRALQAADLHRQPVGRLADEGAGRQEEGRARARRQRRRHRRQDRRPRLGGQAHRSSARSPTPARSASASSGCSSTRRSGTRSWSSSSPASRALKVGDPLDPTTDVGPMVDEHQPRRGPSAGSTRRSRWAARSCSAARPTARSSRRRS